VRSSCSIPAGLAAALARLSLAPAGAAAQELAPSFNAQVHAGVAVPAGGMYKITSAGPSLGAGVLYRFLPNFGVRADFTADLMDGNQDSFGNQFPSMKLFHITAGMQADLPRPHWQDVPLTTTVNLGAGLTIMDANQNDVPGPVGAFSKTFFAATGGVQVGYQFTDRFNLYASGQAYLTFGKRADLQLFADHSPEVDSFRNVWDFPFSLGARFTFPTGE
jgi:hypothetical protein